MFEIRWIFGIMVIFIFLGCMRPGHRQIGGGASPLDCPAPDAITFWGHACCYIDINGIGIVTDPVFDDSYAIFRNRIIPPPPPFSYSDADIVLISHAHRDHLSPKTLAAFPKSAVILCSEPSERLLSDLEIPVKVMAPGQIYRFKEVTVIAVPAYHPGGRNSLNADADGRALGFIIHTPDRVLYYSGDTEYFSGLRTIGKTYRPDIAIINLTSHLSDSDFIRAVFAIGAPRVIPIHYGAFSGPSSRNGPRRCGELKQILGSILAPIEVGEQYSIPPSPVTYRDTISGHENRP